MISISDRAASALRDLLASKDASPQAGLRLAVRRGGCAGWQYEMKIAEPEEGDHITSFDGGCLIVAADSTAKLSGCQVDYADGLSDAGFRIVNPQAVRSCGCGTSFETASDPPSDFDSEGDCTSS
ncbi:iron-sulfur cluster assembly protein [Haloferula luteola]|uniref:Iron-sulfur cluster assembly protein n=1 Tax=Haloferula luteola TaxID=595692 RepID=A0A840V5Y9_9BACT|nr:iron-sulfur cluster assembly accessory protein [Haloferula luteola]MBB5353382.1 iron-sulfur cluster assembly protein [Haloferula luteola]